jgi:hypothetical protein
MAGAAVSGVVGIIESVSGSVIGLLRIRWKGNKLLALITPETG